MVAQLLDGGKEQGEYLLIWLTLGHLVTIKGQLNAAASQGIVTNHVNHYMRKLHQAGWSTKRLTN